VSTAVGWSSGCSSTVERGGGQGKNVPLAGAVRRGTKAQMRQGFIYYHASLLTFCKFVVCSKESFLKKGSVRVQ